MRLPDFIIGGAPKCATSSMHQLLDSHPDVGMPKGEPLFFDADDPLTHRDFFFVADGQLLFFDCDVAQGGFRAAYERQFARLQDRRFIGEDSTTYLFSSVAAQRIKRTLPDVKLIFMLRDPVERAFSHYWHLVKSGRATVSFERALTDRPVLLTMSSYARPLEFYLRLFGESRVKVLLFEDFVRDPRGQVDKVTDYIGASRFIPAASAWANRTEYPSRLPVTLAVNRLGQRITANRYYNLMGIRGDDPRAWRAKLYTKWRRGVLSRTLGRANPPVKMREDTRVFLARYLSRTNYGLSEMLGRDLTALWQGFSG